MVKYAQKEQPQKLGNRNIKKNKSVNISSDKLAKSHARIWLQKQNLKIENKFLLIVAQKNAMRANYIKAKIDFT